MTQRIFDIENEKDMADLWDILPSRIKNITKANPFTYDGKLKLINIAWHDKTEITRPVDYEDMIGCVGWFDGCGDEIRLGILTKVAPNDEDGYCFLKNNNIWCKSFRPAKKSELKFYGE